jgi:L-threonylcarbamoyladenylate synthase
MPPLSWNLLRRIRAHLRAGGVIAYATAASFGLGCDPWNVRAVCKIFRLKRRPRAKGMIVVADRWLHLAPLAVRLDADAVAALHAKWPGPHTWLLPAAARVPRILRGRFQTVALRVDTHPDVVRLARRLAAPIVSTSANRSGRRALRTARECARQFGRSVLVVPGRIGHARRPSTVQDFATGRMVR